MHQTNFIGPTLSKSKINDAIKAIRPSEKTKIIDAYWNYVPQDGTYSEDEQLAYIIAAMPAIGRFPAKTIAQMIVAETVLKTKTGRVMPRNYAFSLPVLAGRAMAADPDLSRTALACIRKHKHVPEHITANDMWALQLAMATAIGYLAGNHGTITEAMPECEPYLDTDEKLLRVLRLVPENEREFQSPSRTIQI